MKAAIRSRYGPPEDLEVKDVPTPSPGDREMLIRIRACTVNRTDCSNLTGFPFVVRFFTGFPRPRRDSPGSDFAGIVEETGRLVTRFKTGDRVWGFHDHGLGSHAQFNTVPESTPMAKIPEGFTFAEAASCAEGAHYAFNFINKLELHAGQKVLLNGATGAIGSAGLQLLKHTGLHVTAVCGTENIGKIKALGADRVVDYKKEDFTRDTERYHFIFDAVGKSTFFKCKHLLLPGGIYISSELGPYGQNIYMTILGAFSSGKKVKFPLPVNIQHSIDQMLALTAENAFKPLIDRTYSLDNIQDAFRYVASGEKIGNVVLAPFADADEIANPAPDAETTE
ncbi:MAG: NAD(P)-dependent alcohol dehydrogenase [Cryomorphaceae bacterium]